MTARPSLGWSGRDVAVVGIGRTAFVRQSERSTLAMAAEAVRDALADCGLSSADVDGMGCFSAGDSSSAAAVARAVGVDDVGWCLDLFGGGNYAAAVVAFAARVVAAGDCEVAVVYRSLNGRSGKRFGTQVGPLALGGELQFGGPHGYLVPPQWIAMWARRHQEVYGTTCEDLGRIAVMQRQHAAANEHAIAREPMSLTDYLASPWVNEPLRVPDCAFEVDGAVAVVVTTTDRARDLRRPAVRVLGGAESHAAGGSWDQWADMTTMYSAACAERLWHRTGLSAAEMDIACLYDCFTYTVMATMEDYGFCGKGEVGDYVADGRATYGGDVVVNPHGGLLSEGYLHGLNHHYEAVAQLRGDSGARQVPGASLALVTAGAGPYGGALVYGVDR